MKILYISPENTVGTLTLWKKEHESQGNECRTVTFFGSPKNFKEDKEGLKFRYNKTAKTNWIPVTPSAIYLYIFLSVLVFKTPLFIKSATISIETAPNTGRNINNDKIDEFIL